MLLLLSYTGASGSAAAQTQDASAPQIRYVDFPARIDPQGSHKHFPLAVGSLVFFRQDVLVRERSTDAKGNPVDDSRAVDAASTITRLPHETVVVEPDGTTLRFSADAVIDRSDPARNYTIVIVAPGKPIPPYLRAVKPDLVVR